MPSVFAEPTIQELLDAFEDGIRSSRDRHVDAREGAIYQHFSGPAAILWSRCARRTTDMWRAIYLDSAESTDLTRLLNDRYDFARVEDSYGVGTATLRRATTSAGAGTVWRGTRLSTFGTASTSKRYVVTNEPPVAASATTVTVDIRAEQVGPGTAISLQDPRTARVEDPLWDPTWEVARLECSDGTSFEGAPTARARFRDQQRLARPGFYESIIEACKVAGAVNALLFPSDHAGDENDIGLNMAYVGDGGFQGNDALVRTVTFALERTRVLGDQLQVRPLTRTNLAIASRVYLWDSPARVNAEDTIKRLVGAIDGYFNEARFGYQRDALAGAMLKAAPAVQHVEFDGPLSDADVVSMVDGMLNFPASLSRYVVSPNDISLSLLPPL